jgi:hypothetical protein
MNRCPAEYLNHSLARGMRGRWGLPTGPTLAIDGEQPQRIAGRLCGFRRGLALLALGWCLTAIDLVEACQSTDSAAGANVALNESPGAKANPALDDPVKPGEPRELTFDDLKFDIEKGADFKESMLTEALQKLDGQKVRLRGFVRPGFKQSGIKNFVLVRDNQECCFGPGAALYDCVMVKMSDDQAIEFTVRPITVVGTMQLKKYVGKDGKVWAIFRLNDTFQE